MSLIAFLFARRKRAALIVACAMTVSAPAFSQALDPSAAAMHPRWLSQLITNFSFANSHRFLKPANHNRHFGHVLVTRLVHAFRGTAGSSNRKILK